MLNRFQTEICLRLATVNDADLLLKLRNDTTTQMASHITSTVKYSTHVQWLRILLQDPLRKLYIAEKNKIAVGSLRSVLELGRYELSWTVAAEYRGQGIGKQMVSILANEIKAPICAELKKGNVASAKIAEFVGMKQIQKESKGILYYQRDAIES
ncbi:GNAT family N-acetyltransferase [Psychromonas sp. CD1]|uniref:GNAT family N-acetyltransferase n=1 Tax=Psychromonas sp. CD1 TaxID=1979839 RepID=UPI000B9B9803|nr:GNAT family N-acetyltransferase [Psychromonas sp. CD1]